MTLNYLAILTITLVSFFGGAFWHTSLFGRLWGKIHEYDKLSHEEQKKSMEGMWKLLVIEFFSTLMMITTLAFIIKMTPDLSGIHNGFMVWIGFVVPMTISNIIWGNDKKKWMFTKILVSISYRLIVFLFAGYILSIWL